MSKPLPFKRFPYVPFTTEAEKLRALDKRLRDADARAKARREEERAEVGALLHRRVERGSQIGADRALAQRLSAEPKGVQDVVYGTIREAGITFHRPTMAYVWCDHHCAVHQRNTDVYNEGADDCAPANWRAVFIESEDPTEDFG